MCGWLRVGVGVCDDVVVCVGLDVCEFGRVV
jgi:hypothetical protein